MQIGQSQRVGRQLPSFVSGHGVDGQIAGLKVGLDIRIFGNRVLLGSAQEDGNALSYPDQSRHLAAQGAFVAVYDHIVQVRRCKAAQLVADGSAHEIDVHVPPVAD
ncbi:hypothetical protein AXF15_00115 [Desulfomicrobium orale DSM 12838]|uniref:Uncharacterized protein n=1 Tax=Desulfomicrobium orale DSM 12838 TaxID=888061 RepID=A0A0X8JMX4_9BACT|nr:hypothetical protein AXF15_00115 [Desulfomicrobium orale DSM 12838]